MKTYQLITKEGKLSAKSRNALKAEISDKIAAQIGAIKSTKGLLIEIGVDELTRQSIFCVINPVITFKSEEYDSIIKGQPNTEIIDNNYDNTENF